MTFAQLKLALLGNPASSKGAAGEAFPLGTPDNLRPQIEAMLVEAMIEVQRGVECWQKSHTDVRQACELMVQNRTNVLAVPRGTIHRVYTVEATADGSGWDKPIGYYPVELSFLRRWMARYRMSSVGLSQAMTSPAGREGFRQPLAADDSLYGRALVGVWSKDVRIGRLFVAPWLQSTERLVIEWSGIKREWSDLDIVSDEPDFKRLVKLWLLQEYGRHWAAEDIQLRLDTWVQAQADAIVDCEEWKSMPTTGGPTDDEANEARSKYEPVPPAEPEEREETVICFVGDSGTNDANAEAVAAAIAEDEPDLVVIAGDAVYQPLTPAEALAPYQALLDDGRVVVALGNHDLDVNAGADVVDYVANPGNGRYFNIASGPVEVFVLNSGFDTSGLAVEPDGNFTGSKQWTTINGLIGRSCAPWKIAVLHHAPYTSSITYHPGNQTVRWASDLEVHAVVAGHAHQYERGTWRGRRHIVVGTGGRALSNFYGTPEEGSEVRIKAFGYLRLTATQTTAILEFVGTDGVVLDTATLAGDPPVPNPIPTVPPVTGDPVITIHPASQAVELGNPVILTVVATGTLPLTYQWTLNGVAIVGANSSSYTIASVTVAQSYRVQVSNSVGVALSNDALVIPVVGIGGGIVQVDNLTTFVANDYTLAVGIILLKDVNQAPGYFKREAVPSGFHDGLLRIVDSAGNHFTREVFQ